MSAVPKPEAYLGVNNIEVIYDHVILVLKGVSLSVPEGKIVALLGANGAGKTTTLKAISNLLRAERGEVTKGTIEFRGRRVDRLSPDKLVRLGVVQVMEGRHCFAHLTVEENLLTGAYTRGAGRAQLKQDLEKVYGYFSQLKERRGALAGYTSGGEQQMTALGRALMARPSMILLDEPSMGLAPQIVEEIFEIVKNLNQKESVSFLLAEQNTHVAALRRSRLHTRERPCGHGRRRRRARRERGRQGVLSRHLLGRSQEFQGREALPPQKTVACLKRNSQMRALPALMVLLAACAASAQSYPTRPIRLVVGFAPGGAADIIARTMSDPLTRVLGQGVIVDNRPGAGSSLAAEYVAKAAPDGYTIMIASQSGMIINPIVNKNISYDTERDFVAITQVTSSPLVVAVNPSLPVKSIRELIAEAKKNPGTLNFATSGNGSLPHLATALFDALAGVEMVHIPYKSGGLSVQSVLAGDTQVTFATAPSVMPHVLTGKLRGLAVTTRERSPLVEGLPGMEEAGLANYDVSIWYGFFAPKATPRDVVARLFEATTQALQDSKLKAVLAPAGTEAVASRSPADFAAFLRRDADALARVIREAGVKFE